MSIEREKLWGKHGICHCGNCEAIAMRAVSIVGKMMVDAECSQYAVALGIAIAAVGSMSIRGSVADEMGAKFGPFGELIADDQTAYICDDVSNTFKKWMDADGYDLVTSVMNGWIDKANAKHAEEQNLPKGT